MEQNTRNPDRQPTKPLSRAEKHVIEHLGGTDVKKLFGIVEAVQENRYRGAHEGLGGYTTNELAALCKVPRDKLNQFSNSPLLDFVSSLKEPLEDALRFRELHLREGMNVLVRFLTPNRPSETAHVVAVDNPCRVRVRFADGRVRTVGCRMLEAVAGKDTTPPPSAR